MYDTWSDTWSGAWPDVPHDPQVGRVTHLVFVSGQLADSWSEDAHASDYAALARSLAAARQPAAPPPPPPHVALLRWLDEQAGGRAALLELTDQPLDDCGTDVPEADRVSDHQRLLAVADLIDGCTNVLLHLEEWGIACRRALRVLWDDDHACVTRASSAAQVAAGIVWAVGKANGWFPSSGATICTQSELRDHFGLTSYPSVFGKQVQSTIRVAWPTTPFPWGWRSPTTLDLEPLGRADLLTASTRRTLVRLRDQALASAQIAGPDEFYQAG